MQASQKIMSSAPKKENDQYNTGPATSLDPVFKDPLACKKKNQCEQQVTGKESSYIPQWDEAEIAIGGMPDKKDGNQENMKRKYFKAV